MNKIVKIKGSTNRCFLKEGEDIFFSGVLIVDVLKWQFKRSALAWHLGSETTQGAQQAVGPAGCWHCCRGGDENVNVCGTVVALARFDLNDCETAPLG